MGTYSTGVYGVHSIVEDAARLGSPAEETMCYHHYTCTSLSGHWMLPQVDPNTPAPPVFVSVGVSKRVRSRLCLFMGGWVGEGISAWLGC